jgi:hypothetical protein
MESAMNFRFFLCSHWEFAFAPFLGKEATRGKSRSNILMGERGLIFVAQERRAAKVSQVLLNLFRS